MYRTNTFNTGKDIAAIVHDPGIEPLFNPLNAELNPICYLLALLGAHHFLHVSRIRVNCVNTNVLVDFLTSLYYTFQYLDILMLVAPSI